MRRILLLISTILIAGSCDYSYDYLGDIEGTIIDVSTGEPISDASVVLLPAIKTVKTNSDGSFKFYDLDPGQYSITVQREGYQTNRKNVVVVAGECVTTVIDLSLIPTD